MKRIGICQSWHESPKALLESGHESTQQGHSATPRGDGMRLEYSNRQRYLRIRKRLYNMRLRVLHLGIISLRLVEEGLRWERPEGSGRFELISYNRLRNVYSYNQLQVLQKRQYIITVCRDLWDKS